MFRVGKALLRKLVEKGVLPPPQQATPTQSEKPKAPSDEGQWRTIRSSGILDCRPPSRYRAFRVIEGGQSDTKPTAVPGGKPE